METIWKVPISVEGGSFDLPIGAEILTVQEQHNNITMWVVVDPDQPTETRHITVYGTGQPLPENPGIYQGTVQTNGGALVWHVFEDLKH